MKKKKKLFWKVLTAIFSIFLLIVIVGTPIAMHYATVINWALGVVPYRTIKGDTDTDTVYFSSEFVKKDAEGNTLRDQSGNEVYDDIALAEAGRQLCRDITAEGITMVMNNGALPLEKGTRVGLFSQ